MIEESGSRSRAGSGPNPYLWLVDLDPGGQKMWIRIRIQIRKIGYWLLVALLPARSWSRNQFFKYNWFFGIFYVLYTILLYLPHLTFNCVGKCWSNPGLLRLWHWHSDALTTRLDIIHIFTFIIIFYLISVVMIQRDSLENLFVA